MEAIVKIDVASQVSFHLERPSAVPRNIGLLKKIVFKLVSGFEKYFFVCLYSTERASALSCTAKSTKSAADDQAELSNRRRLELCKG